MIDENLPFGSERLLAFLDGLDERRQTYMPAKLIPLATEQDPRKRTRGGRKNRARREARLAAGMPIRGGSNLPAPTLPAT